MLRKATGMAGIVVFSGPRRGSMSDCCQPQKVLLCLIYLPFHGPRCLAGVFTRTRHCQICTQLWQFRGNKYLPKQAMIYRCSLSCSRHLFKLNGACHLLAGGLIKLSQPLPGSCPTSTLKVLNGHVLPVGGRKTLKLNVA